MNFRRRHKREDGARGHSSDWSYPQVERGSHKQGRANVKRLAQAATTKVKEWINENYRFNIK